MLQRHEIRAMFDLMRAMYAKAPVGTAAEDAWIDALNGLSIEDVRRAWSAWTKTQNRAPTPAGLRALHRDIRPEQPRMERGMCEPCQREGGVEIGVRGKMFPPEPACIGPKDAGGPPEPMCGHHVSRYAKAQYLARHPDGFSATGNAPPADKRHSDQLRAIVAAAVGHLKPRKGQRGRSTPTKIEALRPIEVPFPPISDDEIPF